MYPLGTPAAGGAFYAPTVLSGCGPDMLVFSEETFGPVAPIAIFQTEAEVGRRAYPVNIKFSVGGSWSFKVDCCDRSRGSLRSRCIGCTVCCGLDRNALIGRNALIR